MPSYKFKTSDENGNAQYKDIAYPITKKFREKLQENVLLSFEIGEDVTFEAKSKLTLPTRKGWKGWFMTKK